MIVIVKNQIIAGPTIKDFVRMGLHADLSIDAHIVTHQTMHFQIALKQKKLMQRNSKQTINRRKLSNLI